MHIYEYIITEVSEDGRLPLGPTLGKDSKGRYMKVPLKGKHGEGLIMKIDLEDYAKLDLHGKRVTLQSRGYPSLCTNGKTCLIHRLSLCINNPLIMGDHISGDKLDNRKKNLRVTTNQQNQWNSRVRKNNNTGYKGVYWSNCEKKYIAKIRFGEKNSKYLGSFKTSEEAAIAYNYASALLHGEYGRINHVKNIDKKKKTEIENKIHKKIKVYID